METAFERAHGEAISGTLTGVDRLIVHGHLRHFWYRVGFESFLQRQGLRVKDFGGYVQQVSARLKAHAEKMAAKAGRPVIYQDRVVKGKDELARTIAKRDGITEGLICVFSTLEVASAFALIRGSIVSRQRRCLHLYFYLIDRELGFMHVRLQTWFPFQVQIWVNGREWLARQLDKRRIAYLRYENTFLRLDDLVTAARLAETFVHRRWWRTFDSLASRVNPLLPLIGKLGFGSYYWAIDACEIATDVMWTSRKGLLAVADDLFDHALRAFSANDVVRFLGRKILPRRAELDTQYKRLPTLGETKAATRRRPEARRIKHRIRGNAIKMYDKWSVLRVETVINNPADFRVLRIEKDRRGRKRGRWMRMGKGIHNLPRYVQIGQAANRRYLDALAEVKPSGRAIAELDALCQGCVTDGRRHGRLNPLAPRTPRYSWPFLPASMRSMASAIATYRPASIPSLPHHARRPDGGATASPVSSSSFELTVCWPRCREVGSIASPREVIVSWRQLCDFARSTSRVQWPLENPRVQGESCI